MKKIILFFLITTMFFSCKKEEQYNPDKHIAYTHWYQTRSNPLDTLYSVYIPNAFSPNGDGINDEFYPQGYFYLNSFKVFGRNGQVIFETSDANTHWKAQYDGSSYFETVQIGRYIYKLNVADATGKNYEYTGSVMVVK
jgi:gliding motility-associated-like protein